MFGWEFPPHIAGGLGTACYGMTRGLARNDVDVTFVMPRASGDEDERFIRVVNASDVETVFGKVSSDAADIIDKMSFIHIDSNLVPYLSPEDYETYHDEFVKTGEKRWETSDIWSQRYTFSGKYGANLMEEVARYAIVAAQIAKDLEGQFDVIHAHDWLTYYAGIAAKRVSGKPLVVHMHATSFDRSSSDNIDTRVYEIERTGMAAADRVIAVSNLTRNIIIEKYNIPAERVVTVHNAVRFAENETVEVTANDFDRDLAAVKDFITVEGDKAIYSTRWTAGGNDIKWDMVHYDVQLFGGVVLHKGKIAEMATGEGKTLVATLPVFLNALAGKGVHMVTVNDYLARRDAEWMGPMYQFHGLSVDCIDSHQPNSEARRKAYLADITFGTNNEYGFDYLRDNMASSPSDLV